MRDRILSVVIIILVIFGNYAGSISERYRIADLCRSSGQFTVNDVTYRCGAVTQEALDAAYNRQFERCRQWLHNPWRGREMP